MRIMASIFIIGVDEASRIFRLLLVRNGTVVRTIMIVPHLIILKLQITKSYHALEVICDSGGTLVDQPVQEIFEHHGLGRLRAFAQSVIYCGVSNG